MKIIKNIPDKKIYPSELLANFRPDDLFFDIETTGLSRSLNSIYIIGCMYLEKENLVITQYFAESIDDEINVLQTFADFSQKYTRFISFNGETFDIPFINEKSEKYALLSPFTGKESVDLYKIAKQYKHLLKTENLKQKSIEQAFGCFREDKYSGKELIDFYFKYIKTGQESLFSDLMLHNYEDMLGMLHLFSLLALKQMDIKDAKIKSTKINTNDFWGNPESKIIIDGEYPLGISSPLSYSFKDFYLTLSPTGFHIAITVQNQMVKIPYENYKDYVYLPLEDMAIPKILSGGINKNELQKCTADNCYGWQNISSDFLSNNDALISYSQKIINYLLQCKTKSPKK